MTIKVPETYLPQAEIRTEIDLLLLTITPDQYLAPLARTDEKKVRRIPATDRIKKLHTLNCRLRKELNEDRERLRGAIRERDKGSQSKFGFLVDTKLMMMRYVESELDFEIAYLGSAFGLQRMLDGDWFVCVFDDILYNRFER